MRIAGHTFLAKLGKKRLRPGGKEATEWLFNQVEITENTTILEVACNMGTTAIELVKKFGCNVVAIDFDETVIKIAQENIRNNHLSHKITVIHADARQLPFENNQFDIVINEAMLTMQSKINKEKCLREYYRVLKKGGKLLTHDIAITESDTVKKEISQVINVNIHPLYHHEWLMLFENQSFINIHSHIGNMSLMRISGMIRDEGILNTIKIIKNAIKKENRSQFYKMFKTFRKNKKVMRYIVIKGEK